MLILLLTCPWVEKSRDLRCLFGSSCTPQISCYSGRPAPYMPKFQLPVLETCVQEAAKHQASDSNVAGGPGASRQLWNDGSAVITEGLGGSGAVELVSERACLGYAWGCYQLLNSCFSLRRFQTAQERRFCGIFHVGGAKMMAGKITGSVRLPRVTIARKDNGLFPCVPSFGSSSSAYVL